MLQVQNQLVCVSEFGQAWFMGERITMDADWNKQTLETAMG